MPVQNGIGYSQATFDKQDGLTMVLRQHISTVRVILHKHGWAAQRYYWLDLTAGCGHNDEIDCDGSPVIFTQEIKRAGISYDAHLIDREPINTMKLCGAMQGNRRVTVHTGDHATIAPKIIKEWPAENAYGMIYADPNGVPPFDLLADLSKSQKLQRVDFLIRYTGSGAKRAGYRLLDELAKINKTHWIVRDLDEHDRWQWTFLLGLNWGGLNAMDGQGFHYANSPEGRAIIERLHFTKPELDELHNPPYLTYQDYLNHPKYKAVRAQALARAGGICEQCHKGGVSEVHHVQYPPWGTFEENADHLLAVCHRCHCQIHDKEN